MMNRQVRRKISAAQRRRSGFTLVEITVVLAIAAVVTAITVGGFKELTASNRRIACQTNLVQIYQACRLYASDEGGGFPYYDPSRLRSTTNKNLGLWTLYTFSETPALFNNLPLVGAKPIDRYIRNSRTLHCPADAEHDGLYADANKTQFNRDYLSYQTTDDIPDMANVGMTVSVATYQPFSMAKPATTDVPATKKWRRQLLAYDALTDQAPQRRLPAEDTVVTWCK